jgi:hypothetical protein
LVVKIALGIVLAFVFIEVAQIVFVFALLGGFAKAIPTPRVLTPVTITSGGVGVAARTPAPSPLPTPHPSPRSYVVVNSWTGTSDLDTLTFTVGDEWRVDLSLTSSGRLFQVDVYDPRTGEWVSPVADTKLGQNDWSMPQHRAGTFVLKIRADNVQWKVTVMNGIP